MAELELYWERKFEALVDTNKDSYRLTVYPNPDVDESDPEGPPWLMELWSDTEEEYLVTDYDDTAFATPEEAMAAAKAELQKIVEENDETQVFNELEEEETADEDQ